MAPLGPRSVLSSGSMNMPVIGIGTWQSPDQEIEVAITSAIEAGYIHIDTAYYYLNEKAIGRTLQKLFKSGKAKREDIFITTKLPLMANRPELIEPYLIRSLEALQLDYVDLYLIHHPVGYKHVGPDVLFPKDENGKLLLDLETDLVESWKAMGAQVEAGRAKSIGVSNFNEKQMQRLLDNTNIPISNLQVELHVYLQQSELVSFCKKNNIVICAYSPLGSPGYLAGAAKYSSDTEGHKGLSPLTDPVIVEIANKHKKFPAQVLLRYLLQYGVAVIPKSTNPERIKQNIDVFDFELTEEDLKKMR